MNKPVSRFTFTNKFANSVLGIRELGILSYWSKPSAISFFVPAVITLYRSFQIARFEYQNYGANLLLWEKYWLRSFSYFFFIGALFLLAAYVLWKRNKYSLIFTWATLLLPLWYYISPILFDPGEPLFRGVGSVGSSPWDHVVIIFTLMAFVWASYLLIKKVHENTATFSWNLTAQWMNVATIIFLLAVTLEVSQGISTYAKWINNFDNPLIIGDQWNLWAYFSGAYFYAVLYAITTIALMQRKRNIILIVFESQLVGSVGIGFKAYWSEFEYVRVILSIGSCLGAAFFIGSAYQKSVSEHHRPQELKS